MFGYGATSAAGSGENLGKDFDAEGGDARGRIGFDLDPDTHAIHITRHAVDDEVVASLDGDRIAKPFGLTTYLGADAFRIARGRRKSRVRPEAGAGLPPGPLPVR